MHGDFVSFEIPENPVDPNSKVKHSSVVPGETLVPLRSSTLGSGIQLDAKSVW